MIGLGVLPWANVFEIGSARCLLLKMDHLAGEICCPQVRQGWLLVYPFDNTDDRNVYHWLCCLIKVDLVAFVSTHLYWDTSCLNRHRLSDLVVVKKYSVFKLSFNRCRTEPLEFGVSRAIK